MVEFGRNNPCPCMSGKKYKKCCGESRYWHFYREQDLSYFSELFALQKVLQDEYFQKLYVEERFKIGREVHYLQSEKMISKASFGTVGDQVYTITTRYAQIPKEEAIHVAHELVHLVHCFEGYKVVIENNQNSRGLFKTQRNLNDMIYDPLVNRRLITYGFNLFDYLNLSDLIQMRNINPNSKADMFLLMTLYVKRFFDYRNLVPGITSKEIKFNQWVEKCYPQVVDKSKGIIKIIMENGNSNQQETEKTLSIIIEYLELDNLLSLTLL